MISIKVMIALETDNTKKVLTFGGSNISDFYSGLMSLMKSDKSLYEHYDNWETASEMLEYIQEEVEVYLAKI